MRDAVDPIRDAVEDDVDECVELWIRACAARDGDVASGVAERTRTKFGHRALWQVAGTAGHLDGFALVTNPGSGAPTDPTGAAVLGLLAVAPEAQCNGMGRRLLRATTSRLASLGHRQVVLHVLADNPAAIRLYESEGWRPLGEPFEHTLLRRMTQTYSLDL
jgi:ribosomal protein S18 acetylase RimI-like enzyme